MGLHSLYFNRFVCHTLSVTRELREFCLPTSAYIHKCTRSICKDLTPCLIGHLIQKPMKTNLLHISLNFCVSFLVFCFLNKYILISFINKSLKDLLMNISNGTCHHNIFFFFNIRTCISLTLSLSLYFFIYPTVFCLCSTIWALYVTRLNIVSLAIFICYFLHVTPVFKFSEI